MAKRLAELFVDTCGLPVMSLHLLTTFPIALKGSKGAKSARSVTTSGQLQVYELPHGKEILTGVADALQCDVALVGKKKHITCLPIGDDAGVSKQDKLLLKGITFCEKVKEFTPGVILKVMGQILTKHNEIERRKAAKEYKRSHKTSGLLSPRARASSSVVAGGLRRASVASQPVQLSPALSAEFAYERVVASVAADSDGLTAAQKQDVFSYFDLVAGRSDHLAHQKRRRNARGSKERLVLESSLLHLDFGTLTLGTEKSIMFQVSNHGNIGGVWQIVEDALGDDLCNIEFSPATGHLEPDDTVDVTASICLSSAKLTKVCILLRGRSLADPSFVAHSAVVMMARAKCSLSQTVEISWDQLEQRSKIGKGAAGIVYKAVYKGLPVAVKQYSTAGGAQEVDSHMLKSFRRDVNTLVSIGDHPHIVKLLGAATVVDDGLALVMELYPMGALSDILFNKEEFPLTAEMCVKFALDICRGMDYLHSLRVMHRDLKTSNVLVKCLSPTSHSVITDFDTARSLLDVSSDKFMTRHVGTLVYMAPETLQGEPTSFEGDVYSFAMCIYEILERRIPFENIKFLQVREVVMSGQRPEVAPLEGILDATWRKSLEGIMKKCWNKSIVGRPTFGELVEELEELYESVSFAKRYANVVLAPPGLPGMMSGSHALSSLRQTVSSKSLVTLSEPLLRHTAPPRIVGKQLSIGRLISEAHTVPPQVTTEEGLESGSPPGALKKKRATPRRGSPRSSRGSPRSSRGSSPRRPKGKSSPTPRVAASAGGRGSRGSSPRDRGGSGGTPRVKKKGSGKAKRRGSSSKTRAPRLAPRKVEHESNVDLI